MDRRTAEIPVSAVIRLGGRLVPYRFERRRRRTLGITIDVEGLSVAAPLRASWRDIESFLHERERWILSKLEQWSRLPRAPVLHGTTGESLPLFGRSLYLDVRECKGRAVKHHHDRVVVSAPGPRRALDTLVGWLKSKALEALVPRAEHFAAALDVPAPSVGLSSARSQWGVCTEGGNIRLNWRLVHLEPALTDYVVAHEVAHLLEMNHSKRFWQLLSELYPDWRQARERLEVAGAGLPIIGGSK
jgi:predicted metal-dependent hydrolase